jgi:hypothetical protein
VEYWIEGWVYARLQAEAPDNTAFSSLPEIDLLREYRQEEVYGVKARWLPDDKEELWCWGEQFLDGYDILRSMIDGLELAGAIRSGTFVQLPYLPLGHLAVCRVPLLQSAWIDRSVIELCEACALLHDKKFTRLPALDPHVLAWHRFYPPDTRWPPPEAKPEIFEEARHQARAHLGQFKGEILEIGGRPFISFEKYARWERRKVPGDLGAHDGLQEGLDVCAWNAWIESNWGAEEADFHGELITRLDHPLPVRFGHEFNVYSAQETAACMQERSQALFEVMELVRSLPPHHPSAPQMEPLQEIIWKALDGKALSKKQLAKEIGCDPGHVYRGGLNALRGRGLVKNSRVLGGYYRPDSLPPARSGSAKKATQRD